MINSINSTSVQANDEWRKLYQIRNSKTQESLSGTENLLTEVSEDSTRNRAISAGDILGMMQGMQGRPPMGPPPEENSNLTISSEVDTNGDGMVSVDEYDAAMDGESNVLSAEDFFAQVDTDSDGQISNGELNAAAEKSREAMGPPPDQMKVMPDEVDSDADGSLSSDEYNSIISDMGIDDALSAEDFFKGYDTNSDGEITEDEILAGLDAADTSTTEEASSTDSSVTQTTTDNISDQETSAQRLTEQLMSMTLKMMNAYELNSGYLYGSDNSQQDHSA